MNEIPTANSVSNPPDSRIDLSIERTEFAAERTHLAWMRTIITLIASGFAIDKLVEALHQSRLLSGEALIKQAHITGILLTTTGLVLLIIKTVLYIKRARELAARRRANSAGLISCIILSSVVFLVGIALTFLSWVSG